MTRELCEMEILYIDIVSMPEHKVYNSGMLRALNRDNKISICAAHGYVNKNEFNYIDYFEIPDKYVFAINKPKKHIQIIYRERTQRAYQWIKNNVPIHQYDVLWFSYTEPITFWLIFNKCDTPVIYCDHLISEIGNNKIKRWFFSHINKKYTMLYFEKYIGDYLREGLNLKNPLYLIRHPLPIITSMSKPKQHMIFAPANSNDESFIEYLIQNETRIPNNLKIIIRSKLREHNSDRLEVYSHRIPDEEYYSKMVSCAAVLINYGKDYNYRTSTVWLESLVCHKKCFMFCNNTMKYYLEEYSEIVVPFYSNAEFFERLESWIKLTHEQNNDIFAKALDDYSDFTIHTQVENVLRSIKKNE